MIFFWSNKKLLSYLAIARDPDSLLFKFSVEKSDANLELELDSYFPGALKVEMENEFLGIHKFLKAFFWKTTNL